MTRQQLLIGLVAIAVVALGVVAYFVIWGSSDNDNVTASGSAQYKYTVTSEDRTLGNPHAKVTMIEYAAPTCPHCAHFDMTMFPYLKKNYIDTGKVYYVFRVFPLSQVDIAAEAIARCLPAGSYFQFIDQLFRNQSQWDPDGYQIPDVRGALLSQARVAGMADDQTNACIDNQDQQKRITAVGQYATAQYGVSGTPTFLVNGAIAPPFESPDDVKAYLDQVLAKS